MVLTMVSGNTSNRVYTVATIFSRILDDSSEASTVFVFRRDSFIVKFRIVKFVNQDYLNLFLEISVLHKVPLTNSKNQIFFSLLIRLSSSNSDGK